MSGKGMSTKREGMVEIWAGSHDSCLAGTDECQSVSKE